MLGVALDTYDAWLDSSKPLIRDCIFVVEEPCIGDKHPDRRPRCESVGTFGGAISLEAIVIWSVLGMLVS